MTEDTSAAVEAGDGSENVRDKPEKVEAPEADSPEGQAAETDAPKGDDEEAGDQESADELSDKEKRKKDRAYKKRLREEAAEAKRELEQAKARQSKIQEAGAASKAPEETEFDDYSDFIAAKALWRYSQEQTSREAETVSTEVEEAQRKLQQIEDTEKRQTQENFAAQVADARTRYSDFDKVVSAPDVPITQGVVDIVMQSDQGADVAYHLASDKALAAEISAMSQIEAARAIGRIEAKLSAPKPRTTSTAPEPISPVKGKASATKDPQKMSMDEYRKWREGK